MKSFKPEIIFLDWDGTLVSTDGIITKSSELLLSQYPLYGQQLQKFHEFSHKKHFGMTLQQGLVMFFDQYDIGQVILAYREIYDELLTEHGIDVIAGAVDFLNIAKSENIKMAVVTNKKSVSVFPELQSTNLYQYFLSVTSSDMVPNPKPFPDPIYHARDNIDPNIDLERCWFIGDTVSDVEASLKAGCYPFYMDNIHHLEPKHHQLMKEGKIGKVDNYQELSEILKQSFEITNK